MNSLKLIKDLYKDEKKIQLLDKKIYDCKELKYIISKCSFILAARTRASIAAYSSCIPTLVIGYSVKSRRIAIDLFGDYDKYVIPVDTITPDKLLDSFEYIQENEDKIVKQLEEKMPDIKEKSESRNIKRIFGRKGNIARNG